MSDSPRDVSTDNTEAGVRFLLGARLVQLQELDEADFNPEEDAGLRNQNLNAWDRRMNELLGSDAKFFIHSPLDWYDVRTGSLVCMTKQALEIAMDAKGPIDRSSLKIFVYADDDNIQIKAHIDSKFLTNILIPKEIIGPAMDSFFEVIIDALTMQSDEELHAAPDHMTMH